MKWDNSALGTSEKKEEQEQGNIVLYATMFVYTMGRQSVYFNTGYIANRYGQRAKYFAELIFIRPQEYSLTLL